MAGPLSGCADHVPPPPAPAHYTYYPGACPSFAPLLPSTARDIAWRPGAADGSPAAGAPRAVPGGSNADCLVPDSLFDHPPIHGLPYRTDGPTVRGPIAYRP